SSATARRPPAPKALMPRALSARGLAPKPSLPTLAAPAGGGERDRQRPPPRGALPPRPPARDLSAPPRGGASDQGFPRRRGRAPTTTPPRRYEPLARTAFDDGWRALEELPPFKTTVTIDSTRRIITRNDSPDISFDRSINPYRGCEHGCIYCFARPTHA